MTKVTFPMEVGKRGVASKSPKANGEVQYPAVQISTDVCGIEDYKSLGLHADFRAKDECTNRTLNDFVTLHYGMRIPIDSNEEPFTGSGLADIYFVADDLSSNGFVNYGTEWRKMDESNSFVEYRANTFTRVLKDQCGAEYGNLLENNIQRYGFDQLTCQIIDKGNMKVSSVIATISNYSDWTDAFITDGVFDKIGFQGIEAAFLPLASDGVSDFVTDSITAVNNLVGTDLEIGKE